ncbi:MAG TPA: BatD family protein [Opitutaceae bacterium]
MKHIYPNLILMVAAAALCAAPLRAQSVHWDPPGGSLPVGEVSNLTLVFDDCSPDGVPAVPKVDGLRIENQGQSSNYSIINGTFSRSVSVSYGVLLSRQQQVDIPEFAVRTSKGSLRVPAAHFNAAGATVGSSGVSLGDAATARLVPSSESVWAGEVFDLRYSIDVAASYTPSWGRGSFEWDPSPLVTEDWSQPEPFETHDQVQRTGLAYHTRAIAPSAGTIRLNPTSQLVSLSVGVTGFGFFQQRQYQQFAVPDQPVSIEVRPLPAAPQGFRGAVGDFRISSKIVPLEVKVGEPVTWTIELSGAGNWPQIRGLPSREAPASFQAIQPKPKRTQAAGKLFDGSLSEDVVLVPTSPGSYTLPPLEFTYFDPKSGSYRTISAPGAPAVSFGAPSTEARAPELPTGALGDPLPAGPDAPDPLRLRSLFILAAAPFCLFVALWACLALVRARQTDPMRPQRQARKRLARTLAAIAGAPVSEKPALLLLWQRDAAALWGVALAAPQKGSVADPEWSALWGESDRFLYGPDAALAPDWPARAEKALSRKTLKRFRASRLFLPRNLIPLVALLAAAHGMRASAGSVAYAKADFPAAEKAYAERVAADPLDWGARHDLSLALAQQDRWGEAAAQASASFVQAPFSPATLRELVVESDKAGFVPEPLDSLIQPGPAESFARLASPGGWERAEAAAAWLLAGSLALLLCVAYGALRGRWLSRAAATLAFLSALGFAACELGHRSYGILSDTRAVVVWRTGVLRSVPTEADTAQKTTPLPAGSSAVADKAFIGWVRLSFPNGQTGWVPRSEVVYLWRSPPD